MPSLLFRFSELDNVLEQIGVLLSREVQELDLCLVESFDDSVVKMVKLSSCVRVFQQTVHIGDEL